MTTPTDDELLALAKKAANAYGGGAPWEQYFAAVKDPAAIIALIERHRAEVERLTRENNNLSAGQKHALESCWAAESALRAERKRVGELEEALEEIASNVTSLGDALDTACNALRRKRAALAGKDAEVTNDQKSCQPAGDSRSAGE